MARSGFPRVITIKNYKNSEQKEIPRGRDDVSTEKDLKMSKQLTF